MSKISSRPLFENSHWYLFYEEMGATCSYDENDTCHLRLSIPGDKVSYFYGETAHADAARYAGDKGYQGLWIAIH